MERGNANQVAAIRRRYPGSVSGSHNQFEGAMIKWYWKIILQGFVHQTKEAEFYLVGNGKSSQVKHNHDWEASTHKGNSSIARIEAVDQLAG